MSTTFPISVTNPLNLAGETSTINLTGATSVGISGAVSVSDSTLVVSGDPSVSYNLSILGNVSTSGGPVTFQVNNNGSGLGNLTLAAIQGTGTPQITFDGGGTVTINGSAFVTTGVSSMPIGTQVTVGPGGTTLALDATNAIGEYCASQCVG